MRERYGINIMKKDYLNILTQEIEIPKVVQEKAAEAFIQIQGRKAGRFEEGTENIKRKKERRRQATRKKYWSQAAAIFLACILIFGVTAAAAGIINAYWQRMESMDGQAVEEYYSVAMNGETITHNRALTQEELARLDELRQSYLQGEIFPETEIRRLGEQEEYQGDGIALDESILFVYLPDRTLSDEELLEMIDLDEKMSYSIREVNQIGYGSDWRMRMEAMDTAQVDEVYFTLYCNPGATSGGYSRKLTEAEQERYNELQAAYEEEGMYTEAESVVIQTIAEYNGETFAVCAEDGNYYLPERELTDDELLQLIDWQHKGMYCLERINKEVDMGLRPGFPSED